MNSWRVAFNDSSIIGHFIEEMVLSQFMKTVNQFELCVCAELKEVAFLRQTFMELNGC